MLAVLAFVLAASWFAFEVNYQDLNAPPPTDPYRMDKFRNP